MSRRSSGRWSVACDTGNNALSTLQAMCSIALLTEMMRMKWRRHRSARSSNSWEARSYRPETSCSRTTALLSGSSRSKSLATFAIIIESSCMLPITSFCSGGVCRNCGRKVRPSVLLREANCSALEASEAKQFASF